MSKRLDCDWSCRSFKEIRLRSVFRFRSKIEGLKAPRWKTNDKIKNVWNNFLEDFSSGIFDRSLIQFFKWKNKEI